MFAQLISKQTVSPPAQNELRNFTLNKAKLRLLLLAFVTTTIACGCSDRSFVVWLPDSKSLIYTDKGSSRLVHFDVMKQARRVVVDNTNTKTSMPAISADGKKAAVLKCVKTCVKGSKASTYAHQVIVYSMDDGSSLLRSKKLVQTRHDLEASIGDSETAESGYLAWSSLADKILFVGGGRFDDCVLYDIRRDQFLEIPVCPIPIGNTPILPNGKGFLAATSGKDGKLVVVDWEGWISEFKDNPRFNEDERLIWHQWNGNIATFVFPNRLFEYDTETMRASVKQQKAAHLLPDEGELDLIYKFNASGNQLCRYFVSSQKDPKQYATTESWLEFQMPSERKRRVLLNKNAHSDASLYPSPNGELVAVHYSKNTQQRNEDAIMIVDNRGTIVATITLD